MSLKGIADFLFIPSPKGKAQWTQAVDQRPALQLTLHRFHRQLR